MTDAEFLASLKPLPLSVKGYVEQPQRKSIVVATATTDSPAHYYILDNLRRTGEINAH